MKKNYTLLLLCFGFTINSIAQNTPSINENFNHKNASTKPLDNNTKDNTKENTKADTKDSSSDNMNWFLPTKNKENRALFFANMYNNSTEKTNFVNSFSLTGNDNGATVQSELVTDNINWLRVSFGSLITTSSNEEQTDAATENTTNLAEVESEGSENQTEAFKRLINGGGNFYLEFVLPLIATNNENTPSLFTSYTYAALRGAADIKGLGNTIDTSTGNASFGINSYLGISSDTRRFNFFVNGSVYYTLGTNDFYNNLAISSDKGFINGKITAGLTLLNIVKISGMINSFGSEESLRSGKIVFGIQILPN